MGAGIEGLCILSVVCGAVLSVTPEGGAGRICRILCGAVLTIALLAPLGKFDAEGLFPKEDTVTTDAESFTARAENMSAELNKTIILSECEEYILDKAAESAPGIMSVSVTAADDGGAWIPCAAELRGKWSDEEKSVLTRCISDELGISEERQTWVYDG